MKKMTKSMSESSVTSQGLLAPRPACAYVDEARSPSVGEAARQAVLARTEDFMRAAGATKKPDDEPDTLPAHITQGALAQDKDHGLKSAPLRRFLDSVQAEPEIRALLAQPRLSANRVPRRTSVVLQQAAAQAKFCCALPPALGEVLYVATVIAGVGRLLASTVVGKASADDVLFTIVRTALHRLDGETHSEAALLRQCLGWGNSDEIDERFIPALRRAIGHALDQVLENKYVAYRPN